LTGGSLNDHQWWILTSKVYFGSFRSFGPNSSQADVYAAVVSPLIDQVDYRQQYMYCLYSNKQKIVLGSSRLQLHCFRLWADRNRLGFLIIIAILVTIGVSSAVYQSNRSVFVSGKTFTMEGGEHKNGSNLDWDTDPKSGSLIYP
jgi:hypothetical protein